MKNNFQTRQKNVSNTIERGKGGIQHDIFTECVEKYQFHGAKSNETVSKSKQINFN